MVASGHTALLQQLRPLETDSMDLLQTFCNGLLLRDELLVYVAPLHSHTSLRSLAIALCR